MANSLSSEAKHLAGAALRDMERRAASDSPPDVDAVAEVVVLAAAPSIRDQERKRVLQAVEQALRSTPGFSPDSHFFGKFGSRLGNILSEKDAK